MAAGVGFRPVAERIGKYWEPNGTCPALVLTIPTRRVRRPLEERTPMKYKPLGRTGLFVSELCLGTMTFGGSGDGIQSKIG